MFWNADLRLGVLVVIFALVRGGRHERLLALLLTVRGLLNLMAPHWNSLDPHDWERLVAFQAVFLAAFAWLAWRNPARWMLLFVGLQAVTVALEGWCALHPRDSEALMPAFHLLSIARTLCLGWAVARRWIAPPTPPPGPGRPDPDLYEEAARRHRLPG